MESITFIEITATSALLLFVVGFIGGMVSGFIGSGGAFVLTPAMMALGVPGVVAVASNMCHKFPKALVGAKKRSKYGQVDWKLGIIMGLFAELGIIVGKHEMLRIRDAYGNIGTDLYVSTVFIIVLAVMGAYVLFDARKAHNAHKSGLPSVHKVTRLAKWVQSINIPGTMVHFSSINARVSLIFIAPLGFATGMLAATIAVGGFIGVPAMMYVLGAPALVATATELVIAFVMGLFGTGLYALDGLVDIRLAMIILAGSLFGIQVGSIGTTYVKDHTVKVVMGIIMCIVLLSRFFYIPGYLSELGMMEPISAHTIKILKLGGDIVLAVALIVGAFAVLVSLLRGMGEHKKQLTLAPRNIIVD